MIKYKIFKINIKFIICILLFIIYIYIVCILNQNNIYNHDNNLKITYKPSEFINFTNFSKPFNKRQVIKIENNTSNVKVYSIKWINIDNEVANQNKFTYKISCKGDNCKEVNTSQIPCFDFALFTDIYVEIHQKHVYTIDIKFDGKESNSYFKGKLIATEEITDQTKYKEYMKSREQRIENNNKLIKQYQELDDK